MKKYLLLIFSLININLIFTVPFWETINLNNWIKVHRITRQDILNNKKINESVRIKDYIIKFHYKMKYNYGHDFKKQNQKHLQVILSRFSLTIEELINRRS